MKNLKQIEDIIFLFFCVSACLSCRLALSLINSLFLYNSFPVYATYLRTCLIAVRVCPLVRTVFYRAVFCALAQLSCIY